MRFNNILCQRQTKAGAIDAGEATVMEYGPGAYFGEVALLRRTGQAALARERLARWRALDPTSSALRFEGALLGAADDALWGHLAADPERVLELAGGSAGRGVQVGEQLEFRRAESES